MRVYRISNCKYIDDLSGTGAANYGGRWNNKGTHILYTAATASLALLESVVHMADIVGIGFCLTCLEIPDYNILIKKLEELPDGWNRYPSPDLLKNVGDEFVTQNKYLVLQLPSVIMPEDSNYLLNPAHPDFKKVKKVFTRKIEIDGRLR